MRKVKMEDLDPGIRDEIDKLFIRSKAKLDAGDKPGAIQDAELAWQNFPEPKFGWDVSKSFTHALAETYRDTEQFENALNLMQRLFASETVKPHQDGPRFIMGTIYFELGDQTNAKKWFAEADKISRGRCFKEENPKYRLFYKGK
jgi:tetratricopeptide (TPR) repeat protein